MWRKISANPYALAVLAGATNVLAFPPIHLVPLLFLCPAFLVLAALRAETAKQAFIVGFVASLVVMLGGFYWVIYTIHIFGHLPWVIAALIYVGFCGFGALNFPIFTWALHRCMERWEFRGYRGLLWYTLGIPALFTVIEYAIPKLFPWALGHAFYRTLWVNQIVEWTGVSWLSFASFCTGTTALGVYLFRPKDWRERFVWVSIPLTLWVFAVSLSMLRLQGLEGETRLFRAALVQANIGSLEKLQARMGLVGRIEMVVRRYTELSQLALSSAPKPNLLLWPETAMPFSLQTRNAFSERIRAEVLGWNVPLITGAYAVNPKDPSQDYNSAYLLEPTANGTLRTDIYHKNILLAFGEYFPGADFYPGIYRLFPQVSNFARGTEQNAFTLEDGTRIGTTICYEAIRPAFFRKVARQGVNLVVNLTNDSWFGPTSEPHQHAALSVFRAIESRIPLLRVTNTGTSFVVDRFGRMGTRTPVYGEAFLRDEVTIPVQPPLTFYIRHGDWFVAICATSLLLIFGFLEFLRRKSSSR